MSWIKTKDGDAINLDHARQIYLATLEKTSEEDPDVPSHSVEAEFPDNTSITLFSGTEKEATDWRDRLTNSKLPLIKVT